MKKVKKVCYGCLNTVIIRRDIRMLVHIDHNTKREAFRILSDLALLEEKAEGLVQHGPGEVLCSHLAPAPVTPTCPGLV